MNQHPHSANESSDDPWWVPPAQAAAPPLSFGGGPQLTFEPSPPAPVAPAAAVAPAAPVAPAAGALTLAPAAPVQPQLAVGIAPDLPVPEQAGPHDPAPAAAVRVGAEDNSNESTFLADLLLHVLDSGCSDLHMTVGAPPTVRMHGRLTPLEDYPVLSPQLIQKTLYAVLTQKQREKFEQHLELDFAYSIPGRARFRVNLYRQRDAVGAAFRLIPYDIKQLADLGVPASVADFAMLPRGFVLVTGPTGSGKSTTLAGIVDLANRERADLIMTVEDSTARFSRVSA